MLQGLLKERFGVATHAEKRNLPVFVLIVAKGGSKNLREPAAGSSPHMEPESSTRDAGQLWHFHNLPVSALIGIMTNGLDGPILDTTGVSGSFDFDFFFPSWNREEGSLGDHVISNVFPELQRQLGLRIQAQSTPLDVLIVDHIASRPSDN